jgi:hypothetical protein
LFLILGIMNEAAKQVANGHGEEDSSGVAVARRDGHQAANC